MPGDCGMGQGKAGAQAMCVCFVCVSVFTPLRAADCIKIYKSLYLVKPKTWACLVSSLLDTTSRIKTGKHVWHFSQIPKVGTLLLLRYYLPGTSWDICGFSIFTNSQKFSHLWASLVSPEHTVAPCILLLPPQSKPLCWRRWCYQFLNILTMSLSILTLLFLFLSCRLEHPAMVSHCSFWSSSIVDQVLKLSSGPCLVKLHPVCEEKTRTAQIIHHMDQSLICT